MSSAKTIFEGMFRWIWRINGLLLLVFLVFGILVLYLVGGNYSDRNDVAQEGIVAAHGASARHDRPLQLGLMRNLDGTSFLYAPLKAPGESSSVSFSGSMPADVRNVLFFDLATRQEHWLFRDNRQIISPPEILERETGRDTPGARQRKQAIGMIFGVRPYAAGASGPVLWNITLASVDGHRVKTLARSVDGMMGFHYTPDEKSLLVFYTTHGAAYVLDVDLQTLDVVSNRKLSTPG